MATRIFTPLEATRTLPLVRRIVTDVLETGRDLLALDEEEREGPEAQDLVARLEDLFRELEAIGCSFRAPNFEVGLVDFPSVIDGAPVHLCWRDDEPDLRYYHAPEAGFAGRKPIPAALLAAPVRP